MIQHCQCVVIKKIKISPHAYSMVFEKVEEEGGTGVEDPCVWLLYFTPLSIPSFEKKSQNTSI